MHPSERPWVWEVGYRVGTALRAARAGVGHDHGASHASPRAHLRRAHWHHHWVGPLGSPERRLELRWHPPVVVAADMGEPINMAKWAAGA